MHANSPDSSYDVVIVGGGTAGLVAATQAARAGAKTLLIEKSGQLGGTTTLNGVNLPGLFHAWGRQVISGIGWELVTRVARESGAALPDFTAWRDKPHFCLQIPVNIALYCALADRLVIDSGVTLCLHTLLASAQFDGNAWQLQRCGKEGLSPLQTKVLIDCTGDANAVALAGLPLNRNHRLQPGTLVTQAGGYDIVTLDLDALESAFAVAVQRSEMLRSDFQAAHSPVGTFLRMRGGNAMHVVGVDGSTSPGKTQSELRARETLLRIIRFLRAQPGLKDFTIEHMAAECGIRETVTIDGEYQITHADYISGRVWEDSLCHSFYPIDLHQSAGGSIDTRSLTEGTVPTIPLRAQLPRNSRQLIVAGRIICGDQEANSAFRVQASCMATGQVAGATAAVATQLGCELRDVPLDAIRRMLQYHHAITPDGISSCKPQLKDG